MCWYVPLVLSGLSTVSQMKANEEAANAAVAEANYNRGELWRGAAGQAQTPARATRRGNILLNAAGSSASSLDEQFAGRHGAEPYIVARAKNFSAPPSESAHRARMLSVLQRQAAAHPGDRAAGAFLTKATVRPSEAERMASELSALMGEAAARPGDWGTGSFVADVSGRAGDALVLADGMPVFQHSLEQMSRGIDTRVSIDNPPVRDAIMNSELHKALLDKVMYSGSKDGGPAYHNLESIAAVSQYKNMDKMVNGLPHAPTKRDQFNLYFEMEHEYRRLEIMLDLTRQGVAELKKRHAAGKKLNPEELTRIVPVGQEQWNEDYAHYRPGVKHNGNMTTYLAEKEAELSDYRAIMLEMKDYLEKADPGLFGELFRQAGKKLGDPFKAMIERPKHFKRVNPPKGWGK